MASESPRFRPVKTSGVIGRLAVALARRRVPLGFAAAAVGFLLLVFPSIPLNVQLAQFAFLGIIVVFAWRRYRLIRRPGD